ncbi:MAG: hypothetical protein P4L67_04000 [Candidatus Pacebacteria bacterium]|nr:hypothetical protein [Candidatus Paceibacterota bacterium]
MSTISSDFKNINDALSAASVTERERAEIISSLSAVDEKYATSLAEFLGSTPDGAKMFLENYRKKYSAQLQNDSNLWDVVLKEEGEYLDSLSE